jgi:predicted metal-binding membrane protein
MASSGADPTEGLLRHERLIVAGVLVLLTAMAWAYLVRPMPMAAMPMGAMQPPPLPPLILMWWLMMVAMMLPSAAPAILLYAHVRRARGGDAGIAQSWVFLAGYLAVWALFSVGAAVAQVALTGPSMALASPRAQAAVLIAAGIYQLSPLKTACLGQCRSPGQFISRHWRPGSSGALRLGVLHGAYCVGCCWLLMALLFVGGVMNLLWVVVLAVLVAVEKLVPGGLWLSRAAGVALLLWGASKALS